LQVSHFLGQCFANFQLEKSDFDLFKEFFQKEYGPNSPDLKKKKKKRRCQVFALASSRWPKI
jgi:hypothetical protein